MKFVVERMPTYETQRVNKSSVSSKSSGVKQKTQAGSGHAMSSANTDGSSNSRSKLHRQLSITKDGLQEDKIRQQMHKQESKDSGIVTEMYTRPKDFSPQPESSSNKGAISKDLASPRSDRSSKAMPKDITRSVSDKGASTKTRRTSDSKRSSSLKGTSKKRGSLKSTSDHVHDRKDKQEEGEIDLFTSKQNGSVEDLSDKKSAASIKGMWKKAVKNLKTASETKISKRGSFIKKKQNSNEQEEPEPAPSGEIDPVYSLLKCAADLPKGGPKSCSVHSQCSGHHSSVRRGSPGAGGDSSGNTSKTSSPSSSGTNSHTKR